MKGLQNLIAARAIIANEANWTTWERVKRRPDGNLAFCALGALEMANGAFSSCGSETLNYTNLVREKPAIALLFSTIPTSELSYPTDSYIYTAGNVAMYNNRHDHAEVLAWFDRTIAKYDGSSKRRQKVIDKMINITAKVPVKELEPA